MAKKSATLTGVLFSFLARISWNVTHFVTFNIKFVFRIEKKLLKTLQIPLRTFNEFTQIVWTLLDVTGNMAISPNLCN
jgi:hypothetical protein